MNVRIKFRDKWGTEQSLLYSEDHFHKLILFLKNKLTGVYEVEILDSNFKELTNSADRYLDFKPYMDMDTDSDYVY